MDPAEGVDQNTHVTTETGILEKNIENEELQHEKCMNKETVLPMDDVPEDFFDIFANQDFLDGLDIVDAWDESERNKLNEQKTAKQQLENSKNKKKYEQKENSEISVSKQKHESSKSSNEHKISTSRIKSKISPPKRNHDKSRRSRERRTTDRELRRDPEKTKRDLERDRQNYVEKKKQKLISKVVETGLVPPGMETEVNLREIEEKEKIKLRKSREKIKSREKSKERKIRKSYDRHRHSPTHRSRSRGKSCDKKETRRNWKKSSRERASERHGQYSPTHRRKRSRSITDREKRGKLRSFSSEKKQKLGEEKLSFIEELKLKLDGHPSNYHFPIDYNSHTIITHPQQNVMTSYYPPNMVQPMQFYPNQNCQYDQNFFIGGPQPHDQFYTLTLQTQIDQMHQPSIVSPVPPPKPQISQQNSANMNSVAKLMEQIKATTSKEMNIGNNVKETGISALGFHNDYEVCSSSPSALQKKISVLSRCQDILTELSDERKFCGKLKVKKRIKKLRTPPGTSNMSPLLKTVPVEFSFTKNCSNLEKPSFVGNLNRALVKAGVLPEVIEIDEIVPPPPPFISEKPYVPFSVVPHKENVLMKMCQTDPIKCESCEKRDNIKYVSVGIQCGESERFNVGVQINESEIINSTMAKNQSLAHLTPAQLLGQTAGTSTNKMMNVYGSLRPPHQDYRIPYQDFLGERRSYHDEPDYRNRMEYQNHSPGGVRDTRFYPHRY